LALVEQAVQAGERVKSRRFIDVGIDLQRRANPAVSEDGLGIASRNVQVFKQRSHRVAQMVDFDDPDLIVVADATEGPDEVARLDWPTGLVVNTGSVTAKLSPCQHGSGLLCSLPLQSLAGQIQQWHVTQSGSCLYRAEDQLALNALKLLADLDLSASKSMSSAGWVPNLRIRARSGLTPGTAASDVATGPRATIQ
jgi:hypothetical protein